MTRLRTGLFSNVILAALLTAFLVPASLTAAHAKPQSGGVVDPSTVLGFGTRPGAMGNAFVALGDDATSVYWNPAALDVGRRKEIFGQYSQAFFDNSSYNLLAYRHPLGRMGTLGGGVIIEGVDDLTRRDVNAATIGTFNVSKMNAMFSYGKQLGEGFYLGTSLHIIRHQIAEFSGTGFGLDVGALYRFTNRYVEYSRAYLQLIREQVRQDADRFYTLGMRAYETGKSAEAFEQFWKAAEIDPSDKRAIKMLNAAAQTDPALSARLKTLNLTNGHAKVAEFLKTHSRNGELVTNLRTWFEEGVKHYDAGSLKDAMPFFEAVVRHGRSNFVTDRLALGINVQNLLQPSIKLKSTTDKIPTNIKLGTSYKLTDWLLFALDVDFPTKGTHRIHFGSEWRPVDWLAVRAGLDHDEPTFGFGFRYQDLRVDYSFTPSDDLDNDFQRVGLSYEFGKSQADVTVERIQRGLTHQSKKDFSSAKQEWESAQKLQPTNPMPRRYIQESEEAYKKSVTEPLAEAERLISAGRLMEARPVLNQILAFDPASAPAAKAMAALNAGIPAYVETHYNAGYLKFLLGDNLAVQDEMKRVLHFEPGNTAAEKYRDAARKRLEDEARRTGIRDQYNNGLAQYRAGRWPEALARFQALLRRDPAHPAAGQLIDQIAQFQAADLGPDEMKLESERFFRIAQADYLDDVVIKAEINVSHSLALWPENDDARNLLTRIDAAHNRILLDGLRLGDERLARGDADAAIAAWRQVLERDPGNFDAQKRMEAAADAIRTFIETMSRMADRMEGEGSAIDALKYYNRVLAVDPYNAKAGRRRDELRPQIVTRLEKIYAEADNLYRRGELEKSISMLSDLKSIDPELTQAQDLQELARDKFEKNVVVVRVKRLANEAEDFYRSRNFDQAVAAWQQVISQANDDPLVIQLAKEAEVRIRETVREAELERAKSFVEEYLKTGDAYLAEGRGIEALEAFRQALEIQPENAAVQWRIASAQKALEEKVSAWIRKGHDALLDGRLDDAAEYYRTVLGVDPDNREAMDEVARIQSMKEEIALRALDASRTDVPAEAAPDGIDEIERRKQETAAQISRLLGRAADARRKAAAVAQSRPDLSLGRTRSAIDLYRSVLKLDPENETARQAVSQLSSEVGRMQKSLKEKNAADIQKFLYSGMGHYRSGRLNEAIADWNRVLSLDPDHTQAREYIKRAEKKLDLLE